MTEAWSGEAQAGWRGAAQRSFKLRGSRVTSGQQQALDAHAARWGLPDGEGPLDVPAVFGRVAPLVLEIGFGMGETTVAMAAAVPDVDVLAVDVHVPGIGALLRDVHALGLTNVRVHRGDAVQVLRDRLRPSSLAGVRVFFPDPWPKTRHRSRRLVDAEFAGLVADRLAPGGVLHLATDWQPYARQMLAVLDAEPRLDVVPPGLRPRPGWRPVTRFERQGLTKGHQVADLLASRCNSP